MKEQLDRIEEKLDKLTKLMNPIVKIDKALRADILNVLAGKLPNNTLPRKQPKPDAWLHKHKCPDCKTMQVILDKKYNKYICLECDVYFTQDELVKADCWIVKKLNTTSSE